MNKQENTPKEYNGKEYTKYEASQKQRQMETLMRKQRQDIKLLQDGGADKDDLTIAKAKYRATMSQYVEFSKQMGLPQQMERVYGSSPKVNIIENNKDITTDKRIYKSADTKDIQELQKQSNLCYNKLDINQKNALDEYTMGGYQDVNDYLNKKFEGFDNIDNMITDIDDSMEKFNLQNDLIVYRGTDSKYYSKYKINDVFESNMYFSTSVNYEKANKFYLNNIGEGKDALMLEIRAPKGTKSIYVGDNSSYEPEDELLLSRGLKYKVIEVLKGKIVLEVI